MANSEVMHLYHICRSGTESLAEGYIGITNNPKRRWREHKSQSCGRTMRHLKSSLAKYDDIEFKILCFGSMEYIQNLEYLLRPKANMGWNIAVGGGTCMGGREVPPETREKLSKALTGRKLSDAHKKAIKVGVLKSEKFQNIDWKAALKNRDFKNLRKYKYYTPLGTFETLKEAALLHNIHFATVGKRVNNPTKKWVGWYKELNNE